MTRTTQARPLNIAEAFPELAGLARTAFRLHPVPGQPTVHDSSIGGPLLWPADEPWPEYELREVPYEPATTLADVALLRALMTQAHARRTGPGAATFTAEEQETVSRISVGLDPQSLPSGPQPLIPLLQLYARDAPGFAFPDGTDLLQVLWVPSDQIEYGSAGIQLRWRRSAEIGDVLLAAPEPAYVSSADLVPVPCVLHPEPVQEFPSLHGRDEGLVARLRTWGKQQSMDYWADLSVAPGWKVGGWPTHFTFRDPPDADSEERCCIECGGPVDALLTVTDGEWEGSTGSWIPVECAEGAEKPTGYPSGSLRNPTMVSIGRGYTLQIYSCVATPSHLPRWIMQ